MANAKRTAANSPCKAKTSLRQEILVLRAPGACFPRYFSIESGVVPADGEVTSQSAIGGHAYHAPAAFTTTHWSVVLEAQGESPAAHEALEKLCRTYWRPIFAFLRRQGIPPEQAEDITQGFFAQLLERRSLDAVRKEKG